MPPSPIRRPWWRRTEKSCSGVRSRVLARGLVPSRPPAARSPTQRCATRALSVAVLTVPMRAQPPVTPLELSAQNPLPLWLHLIMKGWEASAGADCMPQYQDNDVVIISGVRTAVGKFQGSLSDRSAPQLGSIVVREAVKRAQVHPAQLDACIMANVVCDGWGQTPARQEANFRGRPPAVRGM